jgi:hypothetical protein
MSETTISTLPDPSGFSPDPLTDLIREGARKLIEQAVEAELAMTAGPGWCGTDICRSAKS